MAVAYDNATTAQTASGVSLTFSHTTSGSDRGLLLAVVSYAVGGTVITASYDDVAMKDMPGVSTVWWDSSLDNVLSLFRLEDPALGTNNVVVTSVSACEMVAIALSVTGAEQSNLLSSRGGRIDTVSPYTMTKASNVGELCADFIAYYNITLTVDAAQTLRINQDNGATARSLACSTKDGATSVSMTWTGPDSNVAHAVIAIQQVLPPPEPVTLVGMSSTVLFGG